MNKCSIEPLKIPVIGDVRAALARREKSSGFFILKGAKSIMANKNSFFKKGDIAELRKWSRLILGNEEIQKQIESGKMPPEDQKLFITGRAAHEANIYIARQILKKLKSKIAAWEKIIESMPKEEKTKA